MREERLWRSAAVLAVLATATQLGTPTPASAQAVGGTVIDETGGVLPGVTVEARSLVLIEQVRTAVTDGSGQYLIPGLESGEYTVTFSLPGFAVVIREGILLSAGFTANVNIQLTVGSVEETITVTGASPVVDVKNVSQQRSINREILDTIPNGKTYQSLGDNGSRHQPGRRVRRNHRRRWTDRSEPRADVDPWRPGQRSADRGRRHVRRRTCQRLTHA